MAIRQDSVTSVSLPADSRIANIYATTNLADAYSIELPSGTSTDPELLARFIFSQRSSWMTGLMAVRDAIVTGFGLKTARQFKSVDADNKKSRIGIFKIYSTTQNEIVMGEDDKHLDFRLSVLCPDTPATSGERRLIVSTVVHCHNRLGRAYIFFIAPFHRLIVQASLRRAARIGWPGS